MLLRYAMVLMAAAVLGIGVAVGISVTNPPPAKAPLITVETCGDGTIELNTNEKRTLDLHNKTRADQGLQSFCVDPILTKAARAHSREMLDKDYFSHNSFDGETFGERLKRFGYTPTGYSYYTVGENIAYGSGSDAAPGSIFENWMNSSGHKANILNKNFREIGIGVRTGTFCPEPNKCYTGTTMYTVDFGTRR